MSAGNASSEGTGLRINVSGPNGPLRLRTEALSWLKAGMAWQGGDMIGEIYHMRLGLRRASAVLLLCYMQQQNAAFHAADAASLTCYFVYIICYISSLCYCCKANDIRRFYEIRCSTQSQSKRITADTH
ncbi:hypothetical protein ECO26H__p50018 [Escherichia coli O26:H11]|nr:hypothetical protein ECO26H__p50018 [Escherichia coli O26:H11]